MASHKDLLKEKKQSMLAELESIKSLLDGELDKIPVLQEAIVEKNGGVTTAPIPSLVERALASDEASQVRPNTEGQPLADAKQQGPHSNIEGVLPGQQSLFSDKSKRQQKSAPKDLPKKAPIHQEHHFEDNPFLPQHIRQRLNGASALMDDQTPTLPDAMSNANIYTEQMIDQLIAQYMPKIESELRRKLFKAMTLPTDNQKK